MEKPASQNSGHAVQAAPPDANDRRNAFTPTRAFLRQRWFRNAGYAFGVLCLGFTVWKMTELQVANNKLGYEFVVSDDTVTWGKVRRLKPGSEAYKRFLRDVARIRLNMTPQGLKYPDEAASVFIDDARKNLDAELKGWINRAQKLNLFSDPYLEKIEELPPRGDHPMFRISGYAIVSGMGGSLPIRDKEPWFMSLEMAPNPKIGNGEQADAPFVVPAYNLIFGKVEVEKARRATQATQ